MLYFPGVKMSMVTIRTLVCMYVDVLNPMEHTSSVAMFKIQSICIMNIIMVHFNG